MDEPLNITDYVRSLNLSIETRHVAKEKNGVYYVWDNSITPKITIDGEIKCDAGELFKQNENSNKIMKMTTGGRFWFDRKQEADVVMTDMKIGKDNSINATYESMAITDLTDYGLAARFLRWLLRR